MKKLITICLLGFFSMANAQTGGTVMGKVYNSDSSEVVSFAIVRLEVAGEIISTKADFDGKFKFSGVKPGLCVLKAESDLFGKRTYSDIMVATDQITKVDVHLTNTMIMVEVKYKEPKINIDNTTKIGPRELKHNIDIQNPKAMLVKKSSEITMNSNNELIIRGSRPGDVIYYVDGVKQVDMQGVPGVSIGGMTVYTGGIPAKYGDTTGGVVILETKGYFDLYYAWKASQK